MSDDGPTMTDTPQQIRNRIAMWRAELIAPTDDELGPTITDLVDSLIADVRTHERETIAATIEDARATFGHSPVAASAFTYAARIARQGGKT